MIGAGARALLVAAAACGATACAPAVLWSRHTGDRRTAIEVRRQGRETWLVTRDARGVRESARFDEIAFAEPAFSDDGRHFALGARRGGRWHVLRDLDAGPAWDGVGALAFDARGEHLAYAAQDGGRWRLVVDGDAGPPFGSIAEPIAFSDDGARVGYVATDSEAGGGRGCARVVVGGAIGPCWRGVDELVVGCAPAEDTYVAREADERAQVVVRGGATVARADSVGDLRAGRCGTRWAATVRRGDEWVALVDGQPQPPARRLAGLAFGPRGDRLAYAALRDGWSMIVDGAAGERFDDVGPPAFSPEGAHVGYLAERRGARVLVVDGQVQPAAPSASGLTLGPDGRRFAYLAGTAAHPKVVCDGAAYAFPLVVEQTLSFSRDGRHWAVLAGDPARRRLFVAVDGHGGPRFDTTELFGSVVEAVPGGVTRLLGRWVAAEMEILLSGAAP